MLWKYSWTNSLILQNILQQIYTCTYTHTKMQKQTLITIRFTHLSTHCPSLFIRCKNNENWHNDWTHILCIPKMETSNIVITIYDYEEFLSSYLCSLLRYFAFYCWHYLWLIIDNSFIAWQNPVHISIQNAASDCFPASQLSQ